MSANRTRLAMSGRELVRANRGAARKIAKGLDISDQAVSLWKKIPAEHVVTIEKLTGIPREQLRPDLYTKRG